MQSEVFTNNKFMSLEPIRPRVRNILWDSGCSHIMFNQAGAFINLNRQIRGEVNVADGNFVPIHGFGTVAVWKPDGVTGSTEQCSLCPRFERKSDRTQGNVQARILF